ncbi:MAG: ABC transporter permease [Acidobacteria bacterium]|jgi:ABC-type transport system involved in multi-copper enzyme maturation permease subunit|nr:ABC transporter permease [Acidobacteriota bacterium]
MKFKAIALNTFKEAVRNKIFYLLVSFGIFFALSSRFISLLTIGDEVKVLKDVGLAAINFFSVLTAVFTGINLVYKEIEKKTIYNILSKPISRGNFIIGKFIGLAFTLLVALAAMAVIFFLFLYISIGEFPGLVLVYFVLLFMELLIITAISLLFSSFSTPILSSIFTISLYLIGQVMWTFNTFSQKLTKPFEKITAYFLYYILPNLDKFNIKSKVVMNTGLESFYFINALIYAVVYITAILTLTIIIFKNREFQ